MSVIQMSRLGSMGRWGNSVFQWFGTRAYASRHGAVAQFPPWVGNAIVDARDPAIAEPLPVYHEAVDHLEEPRPPCGGEAIGRDYCGYWQVHTSYWTPAERVAYRAWLRPAPAVERRLAAARISAYLESTGKATPLVGLHYRAGDYGRLIFPRTPLDWYAERLRALRQENGRFALFIATEDASILDALKEWNPQTAATLGVECGPAVDGYNYLSDERDPRVLDWVADFYLLAACDIILAGSSTFSFTAAMLNRRGELWRASLAARALVRVDPWNAWPLNHEHQRDYPDVAGAWLDRNPPHW